MSPQSGTGKAIGHDQYGGQGMSMQMESLVAQIKSYLAESAEKGPCCSACKKGPACEKKVKIRAKLAELIDSGYSPSIEPLMSALREFLHAEVALDQYPFTDIAREKLVAEVRRSRAALVER